MWCEARVEQQLSFASEYPVFLVSFTEKTVPSLLNALGKNHLIFM